MKTTPLHSAHLDLGAKMGEFAGYDMPLYYPLGVLKEHEWTRAQAGLFDVSHMGQVTLEGSGTLDFIERLTPSGFSGLEIGAAKYTVLTNKTGGIIDDLIITRCGAVAYFVVINAGRKDVDIDWMRRNLPDDVTMTVHEDDALLALQGPEAERVMREALGIDLAPMPYMTMEKHGDLTISRLGYTGEDGFEISVPSAQVVGLWEKLLAHEAVRPIGLAARDSLRLEMGYPLYGHELDETTSPVEASLNWVIGKTRDGYLGAETIRTQMTQGTVRKRVGVQLTDKGIARDGAEICDLQERVIGSMTSGGFSPTLKKSIGQGYVETAFATIGEKVLVTVRGNNIAAEIAPLGFVQAKTKSMKKRTA